MREIETMPIPCIKIFVGENFYNKDVLKNVISGIEEEAIPFDIEIFNEDDAIVCSYNASNSSVLGVGIGIDSNGRLCVHSKKLPPNEPLFNINYNIDKDKIRSISSNSARLVKGTPFIL